jgi:hypothetical protein
VLFHFPVPYSIDESVGGLRLNVVGVGHCTVTTCTSRSGRQSRRMRFKVSLCGLQVATRGFDVLSGGLDIPAEVLT